MDRRNFLRAALALPLVPLVGSEVFSVPELTHSQRLVNLMKAAMRNGNVFPKGPKSDLSDLYISPEALEDIRAWNVESIDEDTRKAIFVCDNKVMRIYGCKMTTST